IATGVSSATAAAIAAGNTLEAMSAAFLLHRFVGLRNPFYSAHGIAKFVLITGGISTPLSATIGNLSLCLGGAAEWSNFGQLWITWWTGDAVGALVVAPLLLAWIDKPPDGWTRKKLVEAALLLLSVLVISDVVFGGFLFPKLTTYP